MLRTPQDMPHRFAQAWMARDASALAALFAQDADFVNVVGLWWQSRNAIETAHEYGLRVIFADSTLRVGRIKTRSLGQKAAVVQARMHLEGQTPHADTETPAARSTIMTFVMARTESGWQCVAAQNTDIVPGAETHEARNTRADGLRLQARDYRRR
jgi:uncharacterized protein (TIGR02246 family)